MKSRLHFLDSGYLGNIQTAISQKDKSNLWYDNEIWDDTTLWED